MKSVVADYRYRVLCMRIVPVSGSTIYLTDYVKDLVMSGHTYLSTSGYQFSGYSATADFSPASIDIEGIAAASGMTRAAISSGVFDGARCYCFATDWTSPVEDEEPITAGIFGKAALLDDRYQISGTSLVDVLGQTVGQTYGAQCPRVFCDSVCGVSLAANTVTGTLTSVTSASVFYSAARSEAADTFGAGTVQFTSGLNAGLKPIEVKSFAAGVFTTFEPFYYLPAAGDAYTAVRGCRKRSSDCKVRWNGSGTFNNILNFAGFEFIPTGSTYAQYGKN